MVLELIIKLFVILASTGPTAAGQASKDVDAKQPAIYDFFGRRLTDISLSFGGNYSHERLIESEKMNLRYIGPKNVFLKGEVSNCFIGPDRVQNTDVKVKLNGKDILPVKSRLINFNLNIEMANPQGKSGAIQCDHISLMVQ